MQVTIIMRANYNLVAVVTDLQHFADKYGYEMPDESGEMRKKMEPNAGTTARLPSVYVYAQPTIDAYRNRK